MDDGNRGNARHCRCSRCGTIRVVPTLQTQRVRSLGARYLRCRTGTHCVWSRVHSGTPRFTGRSDSRASVRVTELSAAITAIVNPAAGHGKALETWAKVRPHLKCAVETVRTEGPGHATRIAAQALAQGADTIVAVGGDGTINEVVNGFFEQDKLISNRASLAIVPHGT